MSNLLEKTRRQRKAPQVWQAWKDNPSDENFRKVMQSLEPTISSALFSFGQGDPSLKIKARLLTAQAIRNYDPRKGTKLSSHVYNRLQRLKRVRDERREAVHIPESRKLDQLNVVRYKQSYRERYGTEPSIAKLQDALGMSRKRVQNALGLRREVSSTQAESEKGDVMFGEDTPNKAWADYVYHDQDEIGRKVMEWTTGYNGVEQLPKKEVARRLKVTPAAVSKRVSGILGQLEEGIQYGD